jgi:hypothetical protein
VNYGTILIDLETSRPIDILSSREGKDLTAWLSRYSKVKIISRDRSTTYSTAINEAVPSAIQVADRFHLLMNLSDSLDTYFKSVSSKIKSVISTRTDNLIYNFIPTTEKINLPDDIDDIVDQRLEVFNKVKELQGQGVSKRKISTDLGISRNTVRSYFIQESLSPRVRPKSTNIEIFTQHIIDRLNIEGYKIIDIIEEIRKLGFNGSNSQAYNNINAIKSQFKINTPGFLQIRSKKIPYLKPLSPRKLARYIGISFTDITDSLERDYMQTLLENIPELMIVRKLVQIFKTMLARGAGNIRRWIDFVIRSKYKLSGLKAFAKGLLRDIVAVENGIKMPWSNGAVEGHVNRIKSIKRQMYGRASFELLRKKVILSQTG